jgi:hypothetical protein
MLHKKKARIDEAAGFGQDVFRGGELERLEDRLLMAVNISQVGGTLTITGDANDESIHVGDYGDGVRVTVDEDGDFEPEFYEVYYGVSNITINTGNGDDQVGVSDLTIGGNLTINTGTGDDIVFIDHYNGVIVGLDSDGENTIYGNVKVNVGAGNDVVRLADSAIGGNVSIDGGIGSDRVRVGQPEFSGVFVSGDVTIDTGAGLDIVALLATDHSYIEIDGDLTIRTGTNYDVVQISSDPLGLGVEVNGETTIDLGAGDDRIGFGGDIDFNGVFALRAGDGNDRVSVAGDVDFGSATSFDLGKGNDTLDVVGYNNEGVDFFGDFSLLGGAHNDTVSFGSESNDAFAAFHGSATLDGGAGLNRLELRDFPAVYGEFPVFKKFVVFQ